MQKLLFLILFIGFSLQLKGQNDTLHLLEPSPVPDKGREVFLYTTGGVVYVSSMSLLYKYWYSNYDQEKFHFFNDWGEWKQVDKAGHLFTANFTTIWGIEAFKWAGKDPVPAALWGGLISTIYMANIEVFDGFSEKWGASSGDLVANTLGMGMAVIQEIAWEEQKIRIKFSTHLNDYPEFLREDARRLFGKTVAERVLKDYNAQSYWISINMHKVFNLEEIPPWLCLSVGYGASNMFSGYPDYSMGKPWPSRQYYLSLDIDLSEIKTRYRLLNTILGAVNIIKIPAPAIEYYPNRGLRYHWIYF